jgi:predicted amidophosphoribosyltransferase
MKAPNSRRPGGRMPNDVKAWLEVHESWTGWEIAVCCGCGKWYNYMDHLAPYHTEMNWCKKCGYKSSPNAKSAGTDASEKTL